LSILENEIEERYPVADGANETLTMTRQELMAALRSAYKAGAKRRRTDMELHAAGVEDSRLLDAIGRMDAALVR